MCITLSSKIQLCCSTHSTLAVYKAYAKALYIIIKAYCNVMEYGPVHESHMNIRHWSVSEVKPYSQVN